MTEVYILDYSTIPREQWQEICSRLPKWRQERALRCAGQEEQLRSIAAGCLFCYGMKERGIDFLQAEVLFGEHGKPYLNPVHGTLHFNLSHSGNLAAAIFSDGEAGIDVQKIKEIRHQIGKRFFSQKENQYIGEDTEKFYHIWALKESYLKAVGSGLTRPLDSFQVIPGEQMQVEDCYLTLMSYGDSVIGICTKGQRYQGEITTLTFQDMENIL